MTHQNSTLKSIRAAALAYVLFFLSGAVAAEVSILPVGMEERLMVEGDSRTSWYVTNEAHQLFITGGVVLGGYLLNKALGVVAPKVPAGTLLATAGVVLDYTLSSSLKEFAFKQTVRLPYNMYRLYGGHEYLPAWLSPLVEESPTLLTGAWELGRQVKPVLPAGVQQIHTELHAPTYDLFFHNVEHPFFSINIKDKGDCQNNTTSDESDFFAMLKQISCEAQIRGINTVRLTPHSENGNHTLDICLDTEKEPSREGQCHSIRSGEARKALWLTNTLSKPVDRNTTITILSPFSTCALATIKDFILGERQEAHNAHCEDMRVPAVSSHYMQLATLGETGYLLADHTDTQGLALPEMWLVNSPQAPAEALSVELATLEERRIPGPEYGIWRLVSAARSIAHHIILNKAFERFTSPPVTHVGNNSEDSDDYGSKGYTEFLLTESHMNAQLTLNLDAEMKEIEGIQGKVIVVMGTYGKSHLINSLAKGTVAPEGVEGSGNLIQVVRLNNGNYLVEVQSESRIPSDYDYSIRGKVYELRRMWLKKADYILVARDFDGEFIRGDVGFFRSLRKDINAVTGVRDKLKIVFEPYMSNPLQCTYDDVKETLRKSLQKLGLQDIEMGGMNEPNAPLWISQIKRIAGH